MCWQTIEIAKGRHPSRRAVRKERLEFLFPIQRDGFAGRFLHLLQINLVVRRQHHHQMLVARFDHDHFGMMPTFHVLGLGGSLRGYCLWMPQNLIGDFVFIQTLDQLLWYFHNRLLKKVSLSDAISTLYTAAKPLRRERIMYGYVRSLRE